MVNADGDFVIAKPDKAAWELYQEKAKASAAAAAEAAAAEESKALQARGLECPIDKRMFLEPTKTPCCQRTYCNDCISNALIESDFVCPGCATEGVLLDNLTPDDESASKIKEYEADKAEAKKEKEKLPVGPDGTPVPEVSETEPKESSSNKEQSPLNQVQETAPTQSKKRSAEDEPTGRNGTATSEPGTVSKKQKADDGHTDIPAHANNVQDGVPGVTPANFNNQDMPFNAFGPMQGMPMMPFSAPGFGNEAMGFMNPMTMASTNGFPGGMGPGWNPMNMPFNPLQAGMFDQSNGGMPNGFPNMFNGDPSMMFPMPQNGFQGPSSGMNNFSNQQRTAFSTPYSREEDSPYFRQPVNPQRHQARNRRVRPSDYREL
jgi:protein MPE1